jgi:hypothetical protein
LLPTQHHLSPPSWLNFQGELPFAPTIRYSPFAAFSVVADSHSNNSPFAIRHSLPFLARQEPCPPIFPSLVPCPSSHSVRVPCPTSIVSQLPIYSMRDDIAW